MQKSLFIFLLLICIPCYAQTPVALENLLNDKEDKEVKVVCDTLSPWGGPGTAELSLFDKRKQPHKMPTLLKTFCNEQGIVAVSVKIDRAGNVISAEPGMRGTTIKSECLYKAAKEAALKAKFKPDAEEPEIQEGRIIYALTISE